MDPSSPPSPHVTKKKRSRGTTSTESMANKPSLHTFVEFFSNSSQHENFYTHFHSREVIHPKYIDQHSLNNIECFKFFNTQNLLPFLSIKEDHYPDLVRLFYSNLKISEGCIISEMKKVPIVIDADLFYNLTELPSTGELYEGHLPEAWKSQFNNLEARKLICSNHADLSGHLLAGSLKFSARVMHYIIVRILAPRTSNLAQLTKEDIVLMWSLLTVRSLNWATLVRYRMKKALKENAPLPYAALVTRIIRYFSVPIDGELCIKPQRSFVIGKTTFSSFGYRQTKDGKWVPKHIIFPPDSSKVSVSFTAAGNSNKPRVPDSLSMTDIATELQSLRSYVRDRYDHVDATLQTILSRLPPSN